MLPLPPPPHTHTHTQTYWVSLVNGLFTPPPPPPLTHTQTYWVSLVNGLFTLLAMFHLAYLGLMFGGQSEKETSLGIQVAPMITASAHSQPSNLGFELLGMSYNKSTLVCSTACNSPFPPTHTHSHTHTHTQSHTHTQTHIHTQSHTHTITYTHTHTITHTHTHVHTGLLHDAHSEEVVSPRLPQSLDCPSHLPHLHGHLTTTLTL